MKKILLFTLFLFLTIQTIIAQTLLQADGPGNTYELINSVLAPGYNVVEVPDCNHSTFGRHIDEIFDTELNKYVFQFHIHTTPDDDRCIKFDRQRNEIKTYDKSPDSLLAIQYERVEYQWKFKLDSAFQPSSSFTHIHQIKAVGGPEASMPLISLIPRKGTPDQLELRHAPILTSSKLHQVDLAPFKGVWAEAKEIIYYDEVGLGSYEILITKVSNGDTLFNYSNNAIRMWKTNADFLRPKWGIYRSLNDVNSLRDEKVLFANFYINEIGLTSSVFNPSIKHNEILVYPNPTNHQLLLSKKASQIYNMINLYDSNGRLVLTKKIESNNISVAHLDTGLYLVELKGNRVETSTIKVLIQ